MGITKGETKDQIKILHLRTRQFKIFLFKKIPCPWQSKIGNDAARLAASCDSCTLLLTILEQVCVVSTVTCLT